METKEQKQLTIDELKVKALAQHLGNDDQEDAQRLIDNEDYKVLTDEEANELAKEYILDSVWAFNPSFLSEQTGIDIEVFEAIQGNDRCESNNSVILSMIKDCKEFVDDAISADGRGHYITTYDGKEDEETVNGEKFYIYRIN